jgi:hypothetical protein
MRCLAAKLEIAARLEIKISPSSLQLTHSRWSFLHEHLDCFGITQRGAGRQCIAAVQCRRISGTERSSNSTLGIRGRAVEQRPLGQHHHVSFRRCPERRVETCNAASYDEKAGSYALSHGVKSIGIERR